MAELSKQGKTFISEMLDEVMFARRGEEILRGVDTKEIDKFIQDESMRLMEKYGKMDKLKFMLYVCASRTRAVEELLRGKENAPLD